VAAARAAAAGRRAAARVQPAVPSGWRNVPNADQVAVFRTGERDVEVGYRSGRDGLRATVDGERLDVTAGAVTAERVVLTVDGVRRAVDVHRVGDTVWLDSALGATELTEVERFPEPVAEEAAGSLHAPMPGTVVRVELEEGAEVAAGTVVVVLEAMKMEHAVRAPHDGVVSSLHATVGAAVDTGHVLAVVDAR
jgi:acetyl/propionyl-CoA carboxylase alpha subunit